MTSIGVLASGIPGFVTNEIHRWLQEAEIPPCSVFILVCHCKLTWRKFCPQIANQFKPHHKGTARHWGVDLHPCIPPTPVGSHVPIPFINRNTDIVPSYLCVMAGKLNWGWWNACLSSKQMMVCIWSPTWCFRWPGPRFLLLWKQVETLSFSHCLKMSRCEIYFVPTGIANWLIFVRIPAHMQKGNYANHIPRKVSDIILRWNNIRQYQLICMWTSTQ